MVQPMLHPSSTPCSTLCPTPPLNEQIINRGGVAYLILPLHPVLLLTAQLVNRGGGGLYTSFSPSCLIHPLSEQLVKKGGRGGCVCVYLVLLAHPHSCLILFPLPCHPISSSPLSCPVVSLLCYVVLSCCVIIHWCFCLFLTAVGLLLLPLAIGHFGWVWVVGGCGCEWTDGGGGVLG